MKQVHHVAIIAQPAFVEGLNITCPHCSGSARVREDGSAFCTAEVKNFAPEREDTTLTAMRLDFDKRNGITVTDRLLMVPTMLANAGFAEGPEGRFNPVLANIREPFARGAMLGRRHHC
ncbi:MAG: hypothetical protein KGS72_11815 [Cyanobacteria bacterium REEB67]|nr:hypothetical protein [Cyanobacteria bacterium REEB67]